MNKFVNNNVDRGALTPEIWVVVYICVCVSMCKKSRFAIDFTYPIPSR